MTSPLQQLKGLLAPPSSTETVSVVSSTSTLVLVSGRSGIRQLANPTGAIYLSGEALLVRDSVILGRTRKDSDLPVYFV